MTAVPLPRRLLAEALGSALLLAAIVGSGIMADRLADGAIALALLANSVATGATLAVLILVLGPISGAHLNPVVTLVGALEKRLSWSAAMAYGVVQVGGAITGVVLAHAMFGAPLLEVSATARSGFGQLVSEAVATFGLVLVVIGTQRVAAAATPYAVGLYILSAYWFTASTSFANPAVTIARSFTTSFAGIAPADVPGFIAAQLLGALLAFALAQALWPLRTASEPLPAPLPRGP